MNSRRVELVKVRPTPYAFPASSVVSLVNLQGVVGFFRFAASVKILFVAVVSAVLYLTFSSLKRLILVVGLGVVQKIRPIFYKSIFKR